jgi:ligand-binding sensor domain-containing protein/signal transduction histidine kinase
VIQAWRNRQRGRLGTNAAHDRALTPCCRRPSALKAASILIVLLSAIVSHAEKLPVREYTTADGLPSSQVTCDRKDSRGFLWFCTPEGLSRFDGYTFTNYKVDQGLPDRAVDDFLETRHGEYWVGTARGVALFNPKPSANAPMFTVYGKNETGRVNAFYEDVDGTVWIAADFGVFQLVPNGGVWSFRRVNPAKMPAGRPELFLGDHAGNLWIAFYQGDPGSQLWRRSPDGSTEVLADVFFHDNRIISLKEDQAGRIWVGTYKGLALMAPHPQPHGRFVEHVYSKWGHARTAGDVFQTSDGRLWVNAEGTREILTDAKGKVTFRMFDPKVGSFELEDSTGNLWFGNHKFVRNGFVSFGVEDGLKGGGIRSIFQGSDGELYVVTGVHSRYVHRLDGDHFTAVSPLVPGHGPDWEWGAGWGWGQINFQDHTGEWWIATGHTLMRYPKVKRLEDLGRTPPKKIYNMPEVFRLYEDSRGDVWIGSWVFSGRWQRSSEKFQRFFKTEPTAFREDRAANLWGGHWGGGLSRWRQGQLEWIIPPSVPTGSILSILLDHAGRIWVSTARAGLLRFDDPTAEHPTYRAYTTKDGLSSDDVRAVVEDHFGRIYFWTGTGVDRLDPDTGRVRHYSEADGLPDTGSDNNVAFCDKQGRLWFGLKGLSSLDPEPDRPSLAPPPIRIMKVRIRGIDYPVSELGETNLTGIELRHNENQIQIEFASLNFAPGDLIKYQYKLEGAESDWSTPSELRVVNYPSIPPGRYRFLVRAVNADGVVSPAAATVSWRILPPVWVRWWFLTICGLVALYILFMAYRYRVRQLLELERLRTRIATDLHDDIGASLTQIAIMTELVGKDCANVPAAEPLARIAEVSRDLVDSMSDIVWAINPQRDNLGDLAFRMQRFANDVLGAGVELDFQIPEEWGDTRLQADVRREVFLIFKEGINNIVKHSSCTHVQIRVSLEGTRLVMELEDDGEGFQPEESDGHGHGLASMSERARRLGGNLEVRSVPGKGTLLRLIVALGHAAKPQPATRHSA